MNTTTITIETIAASSDGGVTAEDLRWETKVAEQLQSRGVGIYTAFHNGRRIVLHVDRNPEFTGMNPVMTLRKPVNGAIERTMAIHHLGVQVQWTVTQPALREVGHG